MKRQDLKRCEIYESALPLSHLKTVTDARDAKTWYECIDQSFCAEAAGEFARREQRERERSVNEYL